MREIGVSQVTELVARLCIQAATVLPEALKEKIRADAARELSAIGRGIVFDPSRGDEGVWLERRVKKHGPVQVAKARLLTVESDHLEFMFDDPIPKGTYFLAVYTRHGKDTGYAPTRICRQIKTLPCARH